MSLVTMQRPEAATLLVFAFRYALGRQSTAPSTVRDLLLTHRAALDPWQVVQIRDDIAHAVFGGYAGSQCDVDVWLDLSRRLAPPGESKEGGR